MRQVGTLENQELAQRFVDYLLTCGIRSKFERNEAGCRIWIYDEEFVRAGAEELARFREDPNDEKYATAPSAAAQMRAREERLEREARRNLIDARTLWQPYVGRAPVTMFLVAVSVAVTFLTDFGNPENRLTGKMWIASRNRDDDGRAWGLREIQQGEIWRLVSSNFMHLGAAHLVGNLWFLFSFGPLVEGRRSKWRFGLLVAFAGVASNLGQYWHTGPFHGGMSGVLYAIFGYALVCSLQAPELGIRLSQSSVIWFAMWTVACLLGAVGNVGNMAHAVGFAVGVLAALAEFEWRRLRHRGPGR